MLIIKIISMDAATKLVSADFDQVNLSLLKHNYVVSVEFKALMCFDH